MPLAAETEAPFQDLVNFIVVATLVFAGAMAVLGLLLFAWRRWLVRTGRISKADMQREVKDLLDYFSERQTEQDMSVKMRPFWRGRGWSRRQRFFISRELINQKVFHLAESNDQLVQFLRTTWYFHLSQPPWRLKLNGRDWTRMATNRDAAIHISARFGDVGPGSNVQIGTNQRNRQDSTPAIVSELVAALRRDAANADPVNAERATQLAEDLEEADGTGRVQKLLDRAASLTESGGRIFENTMKVLDKLP